MPRMEREIWSQRDNALVGLERNSKVIGRRDLIADEKFPLTIRNITCQ